MHGLCTSCQTQIPEVVLVKPMSAHDTARHRVGCCSHSHMVRQPVDPSCLSWTGKLCHPLCSASVVKSQFRYLLLDTITGVFTLLYM